MNKMSGNFKGFTLIELLIAIVIFGIIITGIISSKTGQQDQTISQQQAVEMQQTVRAVIYLMSRELRSAGYNPHYQNYDAGVTGATEVSLTFTRVASDDGDDNDDDAETDEDGELETITYTFHDSDGDGDNDITIDKSDPSQDPNPRIMAENIDSLIFKYFDQSGVPITEDPVADPSTVRSVRITVTATTDIGHLARSTTNNTRTLSNLVYLRNLGF